MIVRPVFGSSMIPVGVDALMNTPSGPSSLNPNRISKPPLPSISNPPEMPMYITRSATGVTLSSTSILLPVASNFRIPPISAAFSSPPNIGPLTLTPIAAISITGNLPSSSNDGLIFTPSIVPLNLSPGAEGMLEMLSDSTRLKSDESALKSSHSIPML